MRSLSSDVISNMHRPQIAAFFALLLASGSLTVLGQGGQRELRGRVVDGSDGVLPGVSVTASAAGGDVLATAVTDAAGEYVLMPLPEVPVTVRFDLQGFGTSAVRLLVPANPDPRRFVQRLDLAPVTETVEVRAALPRPRPTSPSPIVLQPVPEHEKESVCGPAKRDDTMTTVGLVQALRRQLGRELYTRRDELVIDRGTRDGIYIGQNLVVRRFFQVPGASPGIIGEHSSGLVQVVSAAERQSVAVVIYACDEIMKNDFLAPFTPEPVRRPEPEGTPVFYDAARILFADAGQMLGAPKRLLVIDRGRTHGIEPGKRLTLFRTARGPNTRPVVVGDAVVVASLDRTLQRFASSALMTSSWPAIGQPRSGRRRPRSQSLAGTLAR